MGIVLDFGNQSNQLLKVNLDKVFETYFQHRAEIQTWSGDKQSQFLLEKKDLFSEIVAESKPH